MLIRLKDGKELTVLNVYGQRLSVRGVYRDSLTFVFDPEIYGSDKLMKDFGDCTGTSQITISDPYDEKEYIYLGYSLFHSLVVENEVTQKETNDKPEITRKLIKVTMAQKTYSEALSDAQKSEIDALNEVVADIIGGVY